MGHLDKFRILEKENYNGDKVYIPQVMVFTYTEFSGILWWKTKREIEVYNGFKIESDGRLMFDTNTAFYYLGRRDIVSHIEKEYCGISYDSLELANEAIAKFKDDISVSIFNYAKSTYKSTTKIL